MPRKTGTENCGIAARGGIDAEVDGSPSFRIGRHAEFDHLQAEPLHIGQELGRRSERVCGAGPEDNR
jgi:hypothetical protein